MFAAFGLHGDCRCQGGATSVRGFHLRFLSPKLNDLRIIELDTPLCCDTYPLLYPSIYY
jgi:hypothetical protein